MEGIYPSQGKYLHSGATQFFSDMPLSAETIKGLNKMKIKTPTPIQRESIEHALRGKDILGSSMTGSGKTLAFLIPTLEILYLNKWSRMDGVGAIIISPTRELAYQTFECIKKVGAFHDFSAGLIIGGKNLKFESKRMDQCNIIICTPGRLLQHMDENPLFNASSMLVLILDEADRCLDMGFEKTINCIIENFSEHRQTLLFSATLTKSVKDLARLSLKNPIYLRPSEQQAVTPATLEHSFVLANLEHKITILWSFLKSHLKEKCIVFFSSCKQVKYFYEIFCKLRPGVSLLALYGTLHQDRRVSIYEHFKRKSHVVLFATDIASRGLDFPVVNWVIQLDCPEDVNQYIHRAGRSARNNVNGKSLLVLMPSEKDFMLKELTNERIDLKEVYIDPRKLFSPRAKMESFLAQNKELKETARRAFLSYIKSIYLMKNKKLFQVDKINIQQFAKSLGLSIIPRVRFLDKIKKQDSEKHNHEKEVTKEEEVEILGSKRKLAKSKTNSVDKNDFNMNSISDCDDEDLFTLKRCDHSIKHDCNVLKAESSSMEKKRITTKAALAKRILRKQIQANKKVLFNHNVSSFLDSSQGIQSNVTNNNFHNDNINGGIDIVKIKQELSQEDQLDKIRLGKIIKANHKKMKNKIKAICRNEKSSNKEIFNNTDASYELNRFNYMSEGYGTDQSISVNEMIIKKRHRDKDDCNSETDSTTISKKIQKTNKNISLEETELIAMKLLSTQ